MKSEKQIPQSQPALSGTTVIPKPRTETDISLERAWRVVIFNDEITQQMVDDPDVMIFFSGCIDQTLGRIQRWVPR
jgi:hypothetical protein